LFCTLTVASQFITYNNTQLYTVPTTKIVKRILGTGESLLNQQREITEGNIYVLQSKF